MAYVTKMIVMDQHFNNKILNKIWSKFEDQSTRNRLDVSMKQSQEEGVDQKKETIATIEKITRNTFWQQNLLCSENLILIDTIVFHFGKNFAFRGTLLTLNLRCE